MSKIPRWDHPNRDLIYKLKNRTMKTFFRNAMIVSSIALSAFTLGSCDKNDDDVDNNMNPYTISGNASGSQVVPSVNGTGTGTITGAYDPSSRILTYSSGWTGLTGAPGTAGFYTGASGAAGTAVGTPWTFEAGTTGTGTLTGTMTLTEEQASQLTSGNWYYSYGTTANPNGEVRGQITAVQ